MSHKKRKYMEIGTVSRQIILRVKPEIFNMLRKRAVENNRSLNFECNEILRSALENIKGATHTT